MQRKKTSKTLGIGAKRVSTQLPDDGSQKRMETQGRHKEKEKECGREGGREEKGMTSPGQATLAKGLTKQRPLTKIQEIRTTCFKGGALRCLFVFGKLMKAN